MVRKHYKGLVGLAILIATVQLLVVKLRLSGHHTRFNKRTDTQEMVASLQIRAAATERNKTAPETSAPNSNKDVVIAAPAEHACAKLKSTENITLDGDKLDLFDARRFPLYKIGDVGQTAPLMAVGIPTIKRMNESYLIATLRSMIKQLRPIHRENCVFVVYVAEQDKDNFREVADQICREFADDISGQLLEIVSPPEELYPKWQDRVKVNFGDSYARSMWRSKQNLDAQFLVSYVDRYIQPQYFLLMEDDVIASNDYMTSILQTVQSSKAPQGWLYYSFTPVGGAGKVFHSASMREFDAMLKIYWNYKPLDWILWDYSKTKVCGYDDAWPVCKEKWKKVAVDYGKSLFLHKGKVSSKTNPDFTPRTAK